MRDLDGMVTATAWQGRVRARPRAAQTVPELQVDPPRLVRVLLFAFGAAQFFVDPEPGLPDLLFPFLLLFVTQRAILAPVPMLLLAGNAVSMIFEALIFDSVSWSIISLYMTLVTVSLYSVFSRYSFYACVKSLLLGGALGATLTLLVLATPFAHEAYRYGIRFTGFFKDPNVTAPTALFFGLALLAVRGKWKLAAIAPLIVFAISLSRATYLAAIVAGVYLLVARNRIAAVFGAIGLTIAFLFRDQIESAIGAFFQSLGRQGLVNGYDSDRSRNWQTLVDLYLKDGVPLGPGFSEVNGMSTHSTYLRLLVEQSFLAPLLFVLALVLAWKSCRSVVIRGSLLALALNGIVIDATHWRILFVAIAVALAWRDPRAGVAPAADFAVAPRDTSRPERALPAHRARSK